MMILSVKMTNDSPITTKRFNSNKSNSCTVRALNNVQAQLPEFVLREINLCSKTVETNARRAVKNADFLSRHGIVYRKRRCHPVFHVLITSPVVALEMQQQQQPGPLLFVNWNIINIPLAVVLTTLDIEQRTT